ncbi:hypothetical protein D3C76_1008010 [compost metagenome]
MSRNSTCRSEPARDGGSGALMSTDTPSRAGSLLQVLRSTWERSCLVNDLVSASLRERSPCTASSNSSARASPHRSWVKVRATARSGPAVAGSRCSFATASAWPARRRWAISRSRVACLRCNRVCRRAPGCSMPIPGLACFDAAPTSTPRRPVIGCCLPMTMTSCALPAASTAPFPTCR